MLLIDRDVAARVITERGGGAGLGHTLEAILEVVGEEARCHGSCAYLLGGLYHVAERVITPTQIVKSRVLVVRVLCLDKPIRYIIVIHVGTDLADVPGSVIVIGSAVEEHR